MFFNNGYINLFFLLDDDSTYRLDESISGNAVAAAVFVKEVLERVDLVVGNVEVKLSTEEAAEVRDLDASGSASIHAVEDRFSSQVLR